MSGNKRIGLGLIEAFADREYGRVAASAVAWFGFSLTVLTPGTAPTTLVVALLNALIPGGEDQVAEKRAMTAAEHTV